jgi:RNA polymerase sigma factor (sigma-70 family)
MPGGQLYQVIDYLRSLTGAETADAIPDQQLVERFRRSRDEAAFTALIQRHGPMVLSVCARVLGDAHLAEDAFQATFLVLARKAGAIRQLESLAGWLYRVAYHLAARVRRQNASNRSQDLREPTMAHATEEPDLSWREACQILAEELSLLPDKYRMPLVLCYLEGQTNEEAARELGWRAGSMSRRLAKGRELLRQRLVRRGLAFSTGLLAALVPAKVPAATLPANLVAATARASIAYTAGWAAGTSSALVSSQVAALADGGLGLAGGIKFGGPVLVAVLLAGGLSLAFGAAILRHVPGPPAADAPEGSRAALAPPSSRPAAAGARILLIIAHEDFAYPDYAAARRALERAGAKVVVASSALTPAQPEADAGEQAVTPDVLLSDAQAGELDAILFVGGRGVREFMAQRPAARQADALIRQMLDRGTQVAAVGMGTVVLIDAEVLKERQATGHDLVREKAVNTGVKWTPIAVVRDGQLVTARSSEAAEEFAAELMRGLRSSRP